MNDNLTYINVAPPGCYSAAWRLQFGFSGDRHLGMAFLIDADRPLVAMQLRKMAEMMRDGTDSRTKPPPSADSILHAISKEMDMAYMASPNMCSGFRPVCFVSCEWYMVLRVWLANQTTLPSDPAAGPSIYGARLEPRSDQQGFRLMWEVAQ